MKEVKKISLSYWTLERQEWIATSSCIVMMAGLLFSRALLTASMVVMVLNALHPQLLTSTWVRVSKSRFAWCCTLFFFTYLLSGLWSEDHLVWWHAVQIKLPFLFLPFALLNAPFHKPKFRQWVIAGILAVLFSGIIYSLGFYGLNYEVIGKRPHLPSPLGGDYIRFTIALVLGGHMVVYLWLHQHLYPLSKLQQVLLFVWVLVTTVYIHLQAAKSGLVCFYLTIGFYFVIALLRGRRPWLYISVFATFCIFMVLMALRFPKVQQQIDRMRYEYEVWTSKDVSRYNKTHSFVPRLNSYEVAFHVVQDHVWAGVGAGDVNAKLEQSYEEIYPWFVKRRQIIPHNQFLYTVLAVGLPLSIFLVGMVVAPFHRGGNHRFYTWATGLVMVVGLLIEAMLEIQFGVFVYLFFTLFWMSVFRQQRR